MEARDFDTEIAEAAARAMSADTGAAREQAVNALASLATAHARARVRAEALAITDQHTGLYNARHLRHVLAAEVARGHRFRHPFSLIFLDLDRFSGNGPVLAQLGQRLKTALRSIDFAFRSAPDQFVILLVETGEEGAMVVADRLEKRIAAVPFLVASGTELRVSAKVRVVCFPEHAQTAEALLDPSVRSHNAEDGF